MQTSCDFCAYNEYDEEDECYYCSVNMDEDDMARLGYSCHVPNLDCYNRFGYSYFLQFF